MSDMNNKPKSALLKVIIITLVIFLLAFAARAYRLGEIHYKFDEWLGTLQPGPSINPAAGFGPAVKQIFNTAQYYVTSTMTITTCVLTQVLKLFTGLNMAAMRWWFITAASLGVGLTAFIGARLYRSFTPAAWATGLMGAFSVCAIVFSQFANNFAFTYLMTAAQIAVYIFKVRGKWNWPGFLLLSVTAYVCQLVMYTQLLVTAGLFLTALIEITFHSRSLRRYLTWIAGGLIYMGISFIHFFATFSKIPWDEPFRMYMAPYYPLFLLQKGPALTGWDQGWVGYYLLRLYDLFNYHWSMVFNPGIYRPQQWNWVSVPFLLVLVSGVGCGIIVWWRRRRGRGGEQLAVNGKQLAVSGEQSGKDGKQLAVSGEGVLASGVIPLIFFSILAVHMLANRFLLITFGGTRQCVYMAPIFWLFYGWLICNIIDLVRGSKKIIRGFLSGFLVILPVVPFLVSFPGLYDNRVGRFDPDLLIDAITRYHPERIISPRDSIQGLQLTLMNDPRFKNVHWPGYPYESDILDADLVRDQPGISFIYDDREYRVFLSSPENFPREADNILYLDLYMSYDGRYENGQLRQFYTPLEKLISKEQQIIPLAEKPGNGPKAIHQSIYWPPNSFYMYRVIKN